MAYPKQQSVVSSNIDQIAYDHGNLVILFNSGIAYQCDAVPEKLYIEMGSAASPGGYFHEHIKKDFKPKRLEVHQF